jgi:GAF domain-containing protein
MNFNEIERLQSVRKFDGYNFGLNKALEDILSLAASVCETPVAFITLVDADTQWFKVAKGLDVFQMPRAASFCQYTIMDSSVLVVPDPTQDERFADIPLVLNQPHIRFYAGAPLATDDGQNIGTLCVFDDHSKQLTESKQQLLGMLAKQAIHLMELELCLKLLGEKNSQIEKQNNALIEIAFTQSHEFRGPLSTVLGFMNIIRDNDYQDSKEYLVMMEEAAKKLDEKIHLVVKSTQMAQEIYRA